MLKRLLGFVLLVPLLLSLPAYASSVTLESEELVALRQLIARNKDAADQFSQVRRLADASLRDNPQPISNVISEGRLRTDPEKVRSLVALKDMPKVEALAWSWAVTGDKAYLDVAQRFILAWAEKNKSDGNPINETKFESLVEAYDLVRSEIDESEAEIIDKWLKEKADALVQHFASRRGNWRSHRLKMIGLIGLTIEDEGLWQFANAGFRQQMLEDFASDGSSLDFKTRDALHYHLYAIKPLVQLACASRQKDPSMFLYRSPSGASLQKAFSFLNPYVLDGKKHMEFEKSQVRIDKLRAIAGESSYEVHQWSPTDSVPTFVEAGCLDPRYSLMANKVSGRREGDFASWRDVLNAVIKTRRY